MVTHQLITEDESERKSAHTLKILFDTNPRKILSKPPSISQPVGSEIRLAYETRNIN
jgi:hypothetical protein